MALIIIEDDRGGGTEGVGGHLCETPFAVHCHGIIETGNIPRREFSGIGLFLTDVFGNEIDKFGVIAEGPVKQQGADTARNGRVISRVCLRCIGKGQELVSWYIN